MRRSPYQALAAIFNLTMIYFIMGIFILVALGTQLVLTHFETRPQVIAYLADQATQEQVSSLVNQLRTVTDVDEVTYVSKEEALEIYKQSVGNDPLLLGTITELGVVTAEILPASVEISVKDPERFGEVVAILERSEAVATNISGEKDVDFPYDVVSQLTAWTRGLRLGGLIIIAALALSSVLSIFTVIGMKIAMHKYEISTMKLLGAKGSFISKPFIVESLTYSTVGSIFGWLLTYIALLYATPFIAPYVSDIVALPIDPLIMLLILAGMWLGSSLLGMIAGVMAATRFLRR
jgi:cell division transport system permease protein